MDNMSSWSSCAFELEDIEIIDHKTEDEEKLGKWHCDQCSLFFLDKGKLVDHKKKHSIQDVVKCKYCQKNISSGLVNKECYVNKKCETCEYKCSKCPQRFLRHSSLINHEKKHNSPKKKRSVNTLKKINCNATENVTVSKGFKRKLEASDVEERNREINLHESVKMKNNSKRKLNNRGKVTLDDQNIPKTSRRLSFKTNKSTEEDLLVKSPKRSTIKNSKCSEEKGFDKANKNTTTVNPQTVSTNPNLSTNENVVNYKPFSCHVCGDTFASDNVLLEHIRTHGENAAKNFKCKFCGDKFGDIYKMQYHLAICPLAEDELESSLKQVIPKNVLIKTSLNSSSPRKRGRPKKIVETTLDGDGEGSKNESTPPSPKRRYVRRRKSEVLESNGAVVHSFESPLTKQLKTFQNKDKELSCGINRNTLAKNNTDLTVADSVTDVYKESDQDDGKKKIHQCPFPRCDFKFTREKALLCHMRNHSDDFDDSLKCHKCDIPFDDIHALRQHINTCKGIKEEKDDDFHRKDACDVSPNRTFHRSRKEFVCNQCGRSHQSQEKLNRCIHEDLQAEGSTVCRICGVDAEDKTALKKHFTNTHPNNFPYQCQICKVEFDSTLAAHEHRMTHQEIGEQFTCVICSAKFPSYKTLYFHYTKDHVEQSESICKICNITFPNHMALEEHNYVRHKGKDRFKCIFCHKAYASSVYLTVHMKTHTTKFFKCKICYRPFTDKASLFQHMLFHASSLGTEKPLKCAICLAAYAKESALKYHILGHINNDTTLNCLVCGKTLSDRDLMCTHLFDHSIRITENKMTERETEWVDMIKDRKSVVKQEKHHLTSSNNLRIENGHSPVKRGRGRPRKSLAGELLGQKQLTEKSERRSEGGVTPRVIASTNDNPIRSVVLDEERKDNIKKKKKEKKDETILEMESSQKMGNDGFYVVKETNNYSHKHKRSSSRNKSQNNEMDHELENLSETNLSVVKNEVRTKDNFTQPSKYTEINGTSKTKVRPMSFKLFSSISSTRTKGVNKDINCSQKKGLPHNSYNSASCDFLTSDEKTLDREPDGEDPLGGIEIPYIFERKGLKNKSWLEKDNSDLICLYETDKQALSIKEEEPNLNDNESRNSNDFIKEEKYIEPTRGLTKYSCTTCLISLSSQEELLLHNTTHIL